MLENSCWGVEGGFLGLFICFHSKHNCQGHRGERLGGLSRLTRGSLSDFPGHHLPAVTQPVSPKVRSQPQLFVVALLALPCQVLCKSSCLYTSHSKFRSMVFQCLPTWLCPVAPHLLWSSSAWLHFFGRRCLVPGVGSSSSYVWLALPGSQACRHTQVLHFKRDASKSMWTWDLLSGDSGCILISGCQFLEQWKSNSSL